MGRSEVKALSSLLSIGYEKFGLARDSKQRAKPRCAPESKIRKLRSHPEGGGMGGWNRGLAGLPDKINKRRKSSAAA